MNEVFDLFIVWRLVLLFVQMIISFKSVLHSTKSTLRQTAESGRSLTLHSTFQLLLRNENIFIAGRSSWGVCASECEGVSLHEECVCVCVCVCV